MNDAGANGDDLNTNLLAAADALVGADAVLITAGAGMGVDSGLPDFRGNEGFWKAYPPFAALGLSFVDLANPRWFAADPGMAWGFYGHRLNLYRATVPHDGFKRLWRWSQRLAHGAFVFTSNVDGHFQKAGFDPARIVECHGAIGFSQCAEPCPDGSCWSSTAAITVDPETFRAAPPLPTCPTCGGPARPNVLMFQDGEWDGSRTEAQYQRFNHWLDNIVEVGARLVVLEFGAGKHVPTVRLTGESIAAQLQSPLVRVNPRDSHGPPGTISIATGALAAIHSLLPP